MHKLIVDLYSRKYVVERDGVVVQAVPFKRIKVARKVAAFCKWRGMDVSFERKYAVGLPATSTRYATKERAIGDAQVIKALRRICEGNTTSPALVAELQRRQLIENLGTGYVVTPAGMQMIEE